MSYVLAERLVSQVVTFRAVILDGLPPKHVSDADKTSQGEDVSGCLCLCDTTFSLGDILTVILLRR